MKKICAKSQHGFTLMELVMVITIMGIMMGMAIPSFRNVLTSQELKNAAQAISNIIRYARSEAIHRSAQTKIIFDSEAGGVLFSIETDPFTQPGVFTEERTPFPPPKQLREPATIKIASFDKQTLYGGLEDNELLFAPNGSTSDSLICLVDENQRTYSIGIVGLTGQVLIWDHKAETLYED